MVTYDIDQTGVPAGKSEDFAYCTLFENFLGGAGDLKPVIDIKVGFSFGQWIDVVTYGNPLPDRPVSVLHQHLIEFGLSHKKYVD